MVGTTTARVRRILLPAACLLWLPGCGGLPIILYLMEKTPPQYAPAAGTLGGYRELPLAGDAYEVRYASGEFALIWRHLHIERTFALLRAAEVTRREGYRFFCISSIQQGSDWRFASYTIRMFGELPRDAELAEVDREHGAALYSCYDAAETRRLLRADLGIGGDE